MPKLKNWSRVEPPRIEQVEMQWENDSDRQDVYIEEASYRDRDKNYIKGYIVILQDRNRRKRVIINKEETLEEARKSAVKFMRKNPVVGFLPGLETDSWGFVKK